MSGRFQLLPSSYSGPGKVLEDLKAMVPAVLTVQLFQFYLFSFIFKASLYLSFAFRKQTLLDPLPLTC